MKNMKKNVKGMGKKPKIFAVGDIHGCFEKLVQLMDRLPFDPKEDFLVFLGDYIDRGNESSKVISYLLALKERCRNIFFLMGNHEHVLLEYARTGDEEYLRILRKIGIEETLRSYGDSPVRSLYDLSFLPSDHRSFLEQLLPYYETEDYLFVHSGLPPGIAPENCPIEALLSVRGTFLWHPVTLDKLIVFGHTPFETPFVTSDKIGIDTGAVYGNMLTAVELPRVRFYHS
ncbi:metallophosphoesterase family protein [Desulforhabdus amnigena]|uniref:Serine/threonine protein phosphatase n=1 Tax=Desulforhabdus amnigena TaxID=40218 RepID=A0A9W6D3V6_9BACT|nr:metallophosphoesterase family protein [Desulforhabdus amnigena]GLI34419.1 serine/threonine protein phosphatase [Desulforhabdus amnigena]